MNTKDKNLLVLKKSASTNESIAFNPTNLNLREAKSYAGTMVESNLYDSISNQQRYQNPQENCLELFCKDYEKSSNKSGAKNKMLATRDALTDEVFYINDDLLNYRGKKYSPKEISHTWKKDCRMWLWKNNNDFKKNRSIADVKSK